MSPEDYKKGQLEDGKETQAERTKKSLLELLKSDENLRNSLFGQLKAEQNDEYALKRSMETVSAEDRHALSKMGFPVQPFHRDLDQEAKLTHPHRNLEVEVNDVLKASHF